MLAQRIMPCLLVHDQGLVKSVNFKDYNYIGDPINAVKIFNEKEVDEIVIIDIDASSNDNAPNYKLIENLASECRMPLCYGGGIKTVDHVAKIIKLGVEKVALGSVALENPSLIADAAEIVGSQSIVVVLDVKKTMWKNELFIYNGKKKIKKTPVEYARYVESLGAGEIILNSIDNDGLMKGYDLELAKKIRDSVNVPLTILGGAGCLEDIKKLFSYCGQVGAAAGSLFVYKGPYKAVLISYPDLDEKKALVYG